MYYKFQDISLGIYSLKLPSLYVLYIKKIYVNLFQHNIDRLDDTNIRRLDDTSNEFWLQTWMLVWLFANVSCLIFT